MPSKSSKSKSNTKTQKIDPRDRQLRWVRIAFGVFALLLILSMLLSLVNKF